MIKILLVILISAPTAFAECSKPVQVIKQGQAAECDGFLFSDEAEKRAAQARDDVEYYKELNGMLDLRVKAGTNREDILEKRLNNYIKQGEVLERRQKLSKLENAVYFVLGGLLMYGAYQVAN